MAKSAGSRTEKLATVRVMRICCTRGRSQIHSSLGQSPRSSRDHSSRQASPCSPSRRPSRSRARRSTSALRSRAQSRDCCRNVTPPGAGSGGLGGGGGALLLPMWLPRAPGRVAMGAARRGSPRPILSPRRSGVCLCALLASPLASCADPPVRRTRGELGRSQPPEHRGLALPLDGRVIVVAIVPKRICGFKTEGL